MLKKSGISKRVCGLLLSAAVILTTVGLPVATEAEENTDPGVAVKVSTAKDAKESVTAGTSQVLHISAQNQGNKEAVLKVSLLEKDGETADTETEVINLRESDEVSEDDGESTLEDTLKEALTLSDGTAGALDAKWVTETDENGSATERYLTAQLPAGAAVSFDMRLLYRADAETYEKKTLVRAKAFVGAEDVTTASDDEDEDNEAEAVWASEQAETKSKSEAGEDDAEAGEGDTASAAAGSKAAVRSALNGVQTYSGETRAVSAPADSSITSMYNVPVTYYDYLDDQELYSSWRNIKPYGYASSYGWAPFGTFNGQVAQYYKNNGLSTTGLYFGNLFTGTTNDANGNARKGEVVSQISWINDPNFSYQANNSNNLSTMFSSAQGLVWNTLDEDGNLQIADEVDAPWFSESFLATTPSGANESLGKTFTSRFPFRTVEDSSGVNYYEFNSFNAQDNVRYSGNGNGGTFFYGSGTGYGVNDAVKQWWGGDTSSDTGGYGFFPFNNTGDGAAGDLDYGFGAKFEIRFNLPTGGVITGDNGTEVPITFEFTGDDDVWIFIDGKLVLDLGGAHKLASGKIDFSTLTAQVTTGTDLIYTDSGHKTISLTEALGVTDSSQLTPNVGHTMTIFYMERGMIESNLKIRFNMQPLEHEFIAEKQVDVTNVNEGLQETVAGADEFNINLSVEGTAAANKSYQLNKSSGEGGGTESGKSTGENGDFILKDGEQAVFKKQFDNDIGKNFTAVESTKEDGKSYLNYDTIWSATDLENNGYVIAKGKDTTASFKYNKTAGDEFTPVRNKLTYINTPQVGSLSVEKSTVDDDGKTYVDTETDFRFQIQLDMGITTDGYWKDEDITDAGTIYVRKPDDWNAICVYCWKDGETGVWIDADKIIQVTDHQDTYKVENIKGTYDYVIFASNQSWSGKSENLPIYSPGQVKNNYYIPTQNGWLWNWPTKVDDMQTFREYTTTWIPGSKIGYQGYALEYTIEGETGTTYRTKEDGTFTLKAGQKAVFTGIPIGTQFKIMEYAADGYTVDTITIGGTPATKGDDGYYTGTVTSDTGTAVVVTNKKAETSVTVKAWKTVDGGNTLVSSGAFQAQMTGMTAQMVEGVTDVMSEDASAYSSLVEVDSSGVFTFSTIDYQEAGTYLYTIKEVYSDSDNKYQFDNTEYLVKVVVTETTEQMNAEVSVYKVKNREGVELNTPEKVENIDTDIVFNNITNLATLSVQKQLVKENGDPLPKSSWPNQSDFAFVFKLEKKVGDEWEICPNQTFSFGNVTRTTAPDGTFSIQPQENSEGTKAVFSDLVIGTEYRITEQLSDKNEYEFHSATVDSAIRQPYVVGRTYAVTTTIVKGGNEVVYKNYPLSSITITKEDENNEPLEGAEFKLERQKENDTWEQIGDTVTSGADGTLSFRYLHAGKYRITEVKTVAGYVLLKEPIEVTLPYEYNAGSIVNGAIVNQDGTAYDITFTVINGQAFDLPASGLKGVGPLVAVAVVIIAAAGAGYMLKEKQGRKVRVRRRRHRPH